MSRIRCFLLTPTDEAQRSLRRYSRDGRRCPLPLGYHNAYEVLPGSVPLPDRASNGHGTPPEDHNDPRWPVKCACGYEFADDDEWQQNVYRLFARSDGGEAVTIRDAPPGAMWWADWLDGRSWTSKFHVERGGGPHLIVQTPGGQWDIDSKSLNGEGWQRTGTPPDITATPSIVAGKYHGRLRDGWLEEC